MPKIQIAAKMQRILTTKARIVVVYGGRSSSKSHGIGRIMIMKAQTERADVLCGREFQSSIDDSVHKLLSKLIKEVKVEGAKVLENKIDFDGGGCFRFKGFARNSSAVRSAQGFKYSWVEEAQFASEETLEDLIPTIRESDCQLYFTANLMASNDPFSKRFIIPFQKELDAKGFYEDDMHLIIKMNWRDNPWHPPEMEKQRLWDLEHKPRAKYDHVWEGHYNDTVENSIIQAEWFDAAVDAHIKLGFEPIGTEKVVFDPSDTGDAKGLIYRHGVVILDAVQTDEGDINEACDWALDYAISKKVDLFTWDCDGLGLGLKRQVADSLEGKKIDFYMFKGSEGVKDPDEFYQPLSKLQGIPQKNKTNKETFRNHRAQRYIGLADRFYNTYLAVVKGKYIDPDELISVSSKCKDLAQFRSEICRVPRKATGSGLQQIMDKREMKARYKIASPNISDCAMMSEEMPVQVYKQDDRNIDLSIPRLQHAR